MSGLRVPVSRLRSVAVNAAPPGGAAVRVVVTGVSGRGLAATDAAATAVTTGIAVTTGSPA